MCSISTSSQSSLYQVVLYFRIFNPNPTAFMHICLKELSQSEDAIVTQLTNQKLGTLPLSPGSTPTLFLITGIPAVP